MFIKEIDALAEVKLDVLLALLVYGFDGAIEEESNVESRMLKQKVRRFKTLPTYTSTSTGSEFVIGRSVQI